MVSFPYYRRSFDSMKRLYNRIHPLYGRIEKSLNPKIEFEGSYYDKFIKQDFEPISREMGCNSFQEEEIEGCTVMSFCK